ncbi:MAG: acyltransferase [Microbacterium sp.]|uniref:acyltransferase family protein n=1 Tax=Microbacterium sp. TaxID=51671 RepID=UPI001AC2D43F|nr:acyltransferase family protein [Microbacterium sp.]MBN9178526.1 acyltransferase [Microbacterium sp.]
MTAPALPAEVSVRQRGGGILLEVQALRAVAVLLVVVYHVWPSRIPSGFIGVDVFFVISGFLITSHLLREVAQTGTIRVTSFWARRIRRLLPASILVLGICAVLLWTVYPPVFRWPGIEQIAFASFYGLNWLLATNAVDYLHAGDSATLVQHFWSLSVEEQFYFFWPLILLATLFLSTRLALQKRRRRAPETYVMIVTTLIVAASFAYSVVLSHYRPAFAYFDTGTRVWELGLGAIFAVVLSRWPDSIDRLRGTSVLARGGIGLVAGFSLIGASALLIGPDVEFPGWVALFPTVGALIVIVVGMPEVSWLRPLVAWRPVQYVGDISYELYLVHWPLLVTALVVVGHRPNWWQGAILIAVAIVAATVVHRLMHVLPQLWHALWARRRVAFAFAAVSAAIFCTAAILTLQWQESRASAAASVKDELIHTGNGAAPTPGDPLACVGAAAMLSGAECADRFALTDSVDLAAAATDLDRANWCLTWYDQDWLQCERGDPTGTSGTIALLGDSHAGALTGAMDTYFRQLGWKVITYTRFGCSGLEQPVPALSVPTDDGKSWDDCVKWAQRARAEIASRSDITAVVFTNWERSKGSPAVGMPARLTPQSIATSLEQLGSAGKPLVYVEDPPNTGGVPVPECLAGETASAAPCSTRRSESYDPSLMRDGIAYSGIDVGYVSTVDAYCDADTCFAVIGGVVVYTDDNHISDTWARSLMPYIGSEILEDIEARRGA